MAIKVIFPKTLPFDKLIKAVETGLDASAEGVRVDFYTTTRTWLTVKPKFNITRQRFGRTVSTSNQIYKWVSEGTPKHFIKPRNKKALAFGTPFRAKTKNRFIGSRNGLVSKPNVVVKGVEHPGIKAREFAEVIKDKWEIEMARTIQRAIDSVV